MKKLLIAVCVIAMFCLISCGGSDYMDFTRQYQITKKTIISGGKVFYTAEDTIGMGSREFTAYDKFADVGDCITCTKEGKIIVYDCVKTVEPAVPTEKERKDE